METPALEPVAWPTERVSIADPHNKNARIVGFRLYPGDEGYGELGLLEPLFWLDKMCRGTLDSPVPHPQPVNGAELLLAITKALHTVPSQYGELIHRQSAVETVRSVINNQTALIAMFEEADKVFGYGRKK